MSLSNAEVIRDDGDLLFALVELEYFEKFLGEQSMQDDERRFPVVVSAVTRSIPKPVMTTGILVLLVVLLGLFLVLSRSWFEEAPSMVGEWVADVEYPDGVSRTERFEFRVAGSTLAGSATYRSSRRVIESAQLSDTELAFRTRSRERIGYEQRELVHDYVGRLNDGRMVFSMRTHDGTGERDTIEFVAHRP